jgi:serine/threonine protein kinase
MKFYEDFEEYDSKFLVCEFCNGGTLEKYIEKNKKLSVDEALEIIYQISIGISFLHKNGMTHRDLKGDNILIHNGKYKIGDFGFSHDQKLMGSTLGTPLYMAPEIVDTNDSPYNNKVDVWALGIILYNMLTADFPFYDNRRMKLYQKITNTPYRLKSKYQKKWDKNLKNLIEKCLEKKPEFRLSIEEFINHSIFAELKPKYDHIINKIDNDFAKHGMFNQEVYLKGCNSNSRYQLTVFPFLK